MRFEYKKAPKKVEAGRKGGQKKGNKEREQK